MEDLNYCIEFVERNALVLTTPGLTIFEYYSALFWAKEARITPLPLVLVKTLTFHSFSKKDLDFWNCVVRLLAKYIRKEIKVMLAAWLGTHFFELVVDAFVWAVDTLESGDSELYSIESNRDPPLAFIPIPKLIEYNSCARSDLDLFAYF